MEKTKVDINILGQDVSVMCSEEEKQILLKSRDRIIEEAESVKEQTKNVGHDYFLVLLLLNIAGSDIKNKMKLDDLSKEEVKEAFGSNNVKVVTSSNDLVQQLTEMNWENQNLLMMSSGNFDGLDFTELAEQIRN